MKTSYEVLVKEPKKSTATHYAEASSPEQAIEIIKANVLLKPGTTFSAKIDVEVCSLPAYWASALINDDRSGMDDEEIASMEKWFVSNPIGTCVGVSEESYPSRFNGLLTDMLDYSFIKYID